MKLLVAAALLGGSLVIAPFLRQEKGKEKLDKDIVAMKSSSIKWEKAEGMPEGLMVSHLTGESSAAPLVDMLKFSGGTRVPLHWHSANHVIAVISGSLIIGSEGRPDESAGMEVGPGGYFRITAKTPHWTFAKEDTLVVVSGDKKNDVHWLDQEGQPRKK